MTYLDLQELIQRLENIGDWYDADTTIDTAVTTDLHLHIHIDYDYHEYGHVRITVKPAEGVVMVRTRMLEPNWTEPHEVTLVDRISDQISSVKELAEYITDDAMGTLRVLQNSLPVDANAYGV